MRYRPEIDGLRAVSVVAVVTFHADFSFLRGGFIGVDVFFLISGYLITSIILEKIKRSEFSIIEFYEARTKRILPVFITILILTALTYLTLVKPSNQEVEILAQSLFSSIFFYSNIHYPLNSGYFANQNDLLNYIHTWSLSIEEQFYLLYPLIIVFFLKKKTQNIKVFIFFIFVSSLCLSHWGSSHFGKWNFYLLPSRLWELAMGAAIAIFIKDKRNLQYSTFKNLISLSAFIILISSFIYFDEQTPSPSFFTLIPTFSTALVIIFGVKGTLINTVLSSKIFVSIGLLSYSIYLWHQPLLSISRHLCYHPQIPPFKIILITLILSLLLSFLSYKFIERPFRNGKYGIDKIGVFFLLIICLTCSINFINSKTKLDSSDQFSDNSRDLARDEYDCEFRNEEGYYFGSVSKNEVDLILLGDSHARMLIGNLSKELKALNLKGFHPYKTIKGANDLAINDEISQGLVNSWTTKIKPLVEKARYTVVSYRYSSFMTGEWNYFYENRETDSQKIEMRQNILLSRLSELSLISNHLTVIGPVPETPNWGPNIRRELWGESIPSTLSFYFKKNKNTLDLLKSLKLSHPDVKIIHPQSFLSNPITQECLTFRLDQFGRKQPLYYDDDHLSSLGSQDIVKAIFH